VIVNLRKSNQILSESKDLDIFSIDELNIIKKKLKSFDAQFKIFYEMIDFKSNICQINEYKNHPEIFFSSKELENVQINKLISRGKFGKVIYFIMLNYCNFYFIK